MFAMSVQVICILFHVFNLDSLLNVKQQMMAFKSTLKEAKWFNKVYIKQKVKPGLHFVNNNLCLLFLTPQLGAMQLLLRN